MKKLFSLILALSMLLTTIPAVFAVESEVPGEELTVDSVSIEPAADEAAPEEPAGLISAPASAEEVDDDSEALARHARAEARAEALRADVEDRSGLTPSAGQFTTMATNCSVTVRVTFPQAATDSGRVRISLHVPDVMDENGFVSQPSYIYTSQWVTVSKGATYASATFTVPAGSYFASVYAQSPNFGICMNTYHYFNADGSVATNAYTAQPTAISGTRTISVTAPKAPRTISGTVQFSSPLTEDTWFEFYMGTTARWGSSYIYPTFFAAQGATSLSFSIPVSANSYYMELYNHSNGRYGYYDTNGQLSNNWSSRAYVSVVDESVSGLVIDGDCLLGEVDEEEGEVSVWHAANVTINLPETLTEYKQYFVLIFNANNTSELYDCFFYGVSAGSSSFTANVPLREGFSFSLGYLDVTDWSTYSWSDYYPTARYLSEDDGITSLVSNAKAFTMGTEDMSITINDTNNYKLTGTVSLPAVKSTDLAVFPMVEFENGETFGARTLFYAGTTSKNYTIYVPKTQSGSFDHWAAEASGGLSLMLNEDSRVDGNSYTLTGNLALDPIAMPAEEINTKGTISLPEGMTAPAGGLALYAYVNGISIGDYYMAEGESSVTLSAAAEIVQYNTISVTLRNPPENLYNSFSVSIEGADAMLELDITVPEAVTVFGSVIVPDAAKDGISSFQVYTNSYPENGAVSNDYIYLSTLPGETSETYSLKILKGVEGRVYSRLESDGSGCVISQNQYLQADGTSSSQNAYVTLTENTTDANFTFPQGHTISGTISLEEGIDGDLFSFTVDVSGNNWYSTSGSFNGTTGTYKLAVPADYTGTWRVECTLYYEGSGSTAAMTNTWFYYSESGATRKYSDATPVTAPADNIDFVIPAGYPISGTVTFPSELNGYEFGGNVVAIDSDWNDYYGRFSYYNNSYTVRVPTDYTGTYILGISTYSYNDAIVPGLITTTMYLTEEGTLSTNMDDAKEFTVTEAGLNQDFTLPLGETLTLDISAPEGFSGYYEGQISLYVQETYEIVCNQHFWFDGSSTTAALTLPADLADGSYALRVYLYNGSGVITDSTRFWTESGWVTSLSDAQPIDFSVGELSITLPAAKSATVTVNAPEGFSGYYDGYIYLYEDTETGFATVASQYFEFEGSGCDVTLYLPAESESDTYKMAVYLWSGPGCPTDTTYYYAEAGWATSYSSGDYVDFSSGAVSITLPRAKVISGKLVASDGSAVSVPSGAGFTMYSSSGSYANCSSTMSEDGTFTITVSDTLTGDYYLYCSAYSGGGNNVVAGTYYYKSDATSSVYEYDSSDSSYFINLDNGDVTDLVIYVDTGYVLTGTVELGEGATLTNPDSKTLGWVYVSLASETRRTSFSVRLRSDNSDWSYSVAVPKAAATYTLSAYLSPNSSAVTNIYLGDMDYGTVDVTGDGALPSISLTPGRATISADITTPLSGYYTNGRLYVVTSNGTYSRDFYMDNNVSSTTVSVTVAPDDNAETYQLYYYLGNPEGLIRYRDVYVNADGSCTTDSTAASSYSFDTTEHAFTLAEQPPYLMGKIYLPDELDDDDFYVRLYDRFSGGAYFRVHSSTIEEDPDGRKYVPYKKYSSGDYSGSSFYAYYYLSDYTGTALYNKSDYYSRAYLGEDGTFTFGGNSDYHYFTVPDSGCAELDFTLLSWNDGTEDALLQSAHGLTAFEEQTFTFSYPGATYLEVTFDGRTDIDLYINDSYYNAYSLRSYTQTIYLGDTDGVMTVTVPAYTASSATFGFAITSIVPYYPDEAAQTPSVAAVYSAGGSAEADVMASLAAGETVYVSLVGPVDLTGIIGVAVYNSNGRMIDMIWEGLTFENGVVSLPLNFDNAESGVTLSIVVLDAVSWAPLAADTTFSTEG